MSDYFDQVAGRSELVGVRPPPRHPMADRRPVQGVTDDGIDEIVVPGDDATHGERPPGGRPPARVAPDLRAPDAPGQQAPGEETPPADRPVPSPRDDRPQRPPPIAAAPGPVAGPDAAAQPTDPPATPDEGPAGADRRHLEDELARIDALMYSAAGVPVPDRRADDNRRRVLSSDETRPNLPLVPAAPAQALERAVPTGTPPAVEAPSPIGPAPLDGHPASASIGPAAPAALHEPVDRISIDRVDITVLAPERAAPAPAPPRRRPARAVGRLGGPRTEWSSR